ncbi:MAG: hypothetical protein IPJ61_18645 [Tessaracoccus sp.]|uniref:hypothetical protein n=1 Tax=Tessaracoccus sp. TaxID=1971211 RepID=UPI001EB0E630|nr:hypothetical protein [Tessaracoccus sp.]MBK7823004.1 hypothetical protein [Tessaracoccus sp.]
MLVNVFAPSVASVTFPDPSSDAELIVLMSVPEISAVWKYAAAWPPSRALSAA